MHQTGSFSAAPKVFKICLFFVVPLLLLSCAQSEAQKEFEQKAFTAPSGIYEMTVNGTHPDDGENDPDDWQIGPNYVGSISVETPVYPNPVTYPGTIRLLININSYQAVNGLQIYAFRQPGQPVGPLYARDGQLDPGFINIDIDTEQFASSTGTGNLGNLYRLIIYDADLNVISYGDVEVQ